MAAAIQATDYYRTAIYGRLSVLDNGKVNSDSIENQIELMNRYVAEHKYLVLVDRFIDNGHTGTDFERPEWDRLMGAVKSGEINCIVVKDLSRFGRNYIEAGQLLEKVFPRLGVRFISINDGYDSAALNTTDELSASLKNIVNDYYAKDISRKSCSALKAKRQRGDYVGSYAPHGYLKDPNNKNHLIIDPETAPVINRVFGYRAEGMGYESILRILNAENIPSPGRYRFENGIITNNNKRGSNLLWERHALRDILHNIAYLGHIAQGKSASRLYDGIPFHRTSEDEWDIAYNTHEAIISEELFQRVQRVNNARSAAYKEDYDKYEHLPKRNNPYGRRLVCADCGAVLKLYRSLAKGGKKAYFIYNCPTYETHRELGCASKKSIRSYELDQAVIEALNRQIELFLDAKAVMERMLQKKGQQNCATSAGNPLADLQSQLNKKKSLFTSLYTDYRDGLLSSDDFTYARTKYRSEIEALEKRILEVTSAPPQIESYLPSTEKWCSLIEKFRYVKTVTEELVSAFIAEIKLDAENSISIRFTFEDEYLLLRNACDSQAMEVA